MTKPSNTKVKDLELKWSVQSEGISMTLELKASEIPDRALDHRLLEYLEAVSLISDKELEEKEV